MTTLIGMQRLGPKREQNKNPTFDWFVWFCRLK